MKALALIIAASSLLFLVQSCAIKLTLPAPANEQHPPRKEPASRKVKDPAKEKDPLIGTIIDSRTGTPIDFTTLVDRLSRNDVIYLSEKHDNPVHHAIQHRIIQALVDRGQNPILGFEFFSMDDTPLLLSFVDSQKAHHAPKVENAVEKEIRKKLYWDDQTDTMWGYYWDLLNLAKKNGLWAAGLDLDASLKRRITRKGLTGITPLEQEMLFSTHLNNKAYEARMKDLFKQVHCGMGNERMLARLYDTWRSRNDAMGRSIVRLHEAGRKTTPPRGPLVIIMGNGHTEYKLGVPDRVRAIHPGLSQINLSMTEVARQPQALSDYLSPLKLSDFPQTLPADFIWFTGRVSDEDPCARFKKAFEQMKKK